MARIGFTITKQVLFRGVQQQFHNTYYYEALAWTPTDGDLSANIDEIVVSERKLHSSDVTFVRGQAWSAGGTPAQNQMRVQKALSGTGNGTTVTTLDRERAILIRWPAGVDIRGRPVYLRKWYHICGDFQATPFMMTAPVQQNTGEIPQAVRDKAAGFAEELREIGALEGVGLVARGGRRNTGPAQCHRYLEHHQLGDMWRG